MTVWKTRPVDEEPGIKLRAWDIRRVGGREPQPGDRYYLVGYNDAWGEGRVSSHLVEFDPERLRAKTKSGRIYELIADMPGTNADAEYVWGRWCVINGVANEVGVTWWSTLAREVTL